jgi:hypothetical protein
LARWPEVRCTLADALGLELGEVVGAADEGAGLSGCAWVGAEEGVPAAAAVHEFVARVCAAAAAAVSAVSLACSRATVCCRARKAAV